MDLARALALLLILSSLPATAAAPFAESRGDTTIDGHTYTLVPAAQLVARLRQTPSGAAVQASGIFFTGPVLARLAGLDTVRARLILEDVHFAQEVNFDRTVFLGQISCDRARFHRGVSLLDTRFESGLHLTTTRIALHTSARAAVFLGSADFSDTRFAGSASFIEAAFSGPVSFARTRFADDAYFERTRFAGRADFRDAVFERQVSCKEAIWENAVSFAGVRFKRRSLFWQARFGGPADFDAALGAGEIGFENAVFARAASFKGTIFAGAARFGATSFGGRTTFAGSRFQKDAEFYAARFATAAEFHSLFARRLDLRRVSAPLLDLRPPAGNPGSGSIDSTFAGGARVLLQEAQYDRLLVHWPHLAGRLAAEDSSSLEDLAPVYAALRHQLENRGLTREADACRIEWLERYTRSLSWVSAERIALQLFGLSTGYGTDLRRLGLFSLAGVLFFTLLFRLLRPAEAGQPLDLAGCAYLSFSAFLGRPFCHPPGRIRILLLVEALLGWTCWGLFIATALSTLIR